MIYRVASLITGLIVLSVSIFFFIEDDNTEGKKFLFFAIYSYLVLLYFLKSLYYRSQSATFNEIFFVVGMPVIPVIFSILGRVLFVNDIFDIVLMQTELNIGSNRILVLNFVGLMSLPFYIFSLYLLLRTFIRYRYIRLTPYSKGGIPATLLGVFLSIGIGIIYFIVSLITADLLLLLFGFMYAVTGILSFFA